MVACRRESYGPLTADDLLPVMQATPIAPLRDAGRFQQIGDEFLSTHPEFDLPELDGKDESGTIAAMRAWLLREFGPVTEGIELVPMRFETFTSKSGGTIALRQRYRGIDTPGSAFLTVGPLHFSVTMFVHLYELSPTGEPPARVIPASEASDRANEVLRKTPKAMTRRSGGDRPVLEYAFVAGQSPRSNEGRRGASARWDLVWMFRLPTKCYSSEPIVNARTGEATVSVCETGEPGPTIPVERK